MIEQTILFLTATDCGIPDLKKHGLGIGPVADFEATFVQPLRRVFSEVLVYDLWKSYAEIGVNKANQAIVDMVRRHHPKYLIWPSMMYELLEMTFQKVRQEGTIVVGWFFDDEFRFENYSRWWIPYLDVCLTNDSQSVKKYEALGLPAFLFICRSNPEVYRNLKLPYRFDVTFIGRKFGDRGKWIESLGGRGINVEAFGRGWPHGRVSVEEMVRIFNQSKINLCFTKSDGINTRPQLKDRIFHVCMCGGFLLCEYLPGIEEHFEIDREIVCFRDLDEAIVKTHHYLTHDAERNTIALAGWKRAQRDHSQQATLQSIFGRFEENRLMISANGNKNIANEILAAKHKRLPSSYHLKWARGLVMEGYPQERWQEELDLALHYDSNNAQALRMKSICRLAPLRRKKVIYLWFVFGRIKGQLGKRLSNATLLRKMKGLILIVPNTIQQRKTVKYLKNQIRPLSTNLILNAGIKALQYAESLRVKGGVYGNYRYCGSGEISLLYASIYAVLLRHLLGDLDRISEENKNQWIDYINCHQCKDGLYRDRNTVNDIAETEDWWGWRHLTVHSIIALTCLGAKPSYSFEFLKGIYESGQAFEWISRLPWNEKADFVSNTVMNYGVLLQYERDFGNNASADRALQEIFSYLDQAVDSNTGLWGYMAPNTPRSLSKAVQTSYHLWNLYFYDKRPIPFMERAIDNCLATQNLLGGYGAKPNSSACEDIDTIDPLCRFYFLSDYRRSDIKASIQKALNWVLVNRMDDGGFVFERFNGFMYGHEAMATKAEESHLFGTWFRILSIAYICRVLDIPGVSAGGWRWINCPGYQFWHSDVA
jgi:spore maturation protein CgeB